MAILDTFYIMFKGDSSDAERALERVNRSAGRLDSQLNRVARRWLSLYAVINRVTSALKYAFDLTEASNQLGVNTSALQAWGGAVEKTGGSLAGMTKSIESLAEHLGTTPKIAMESLPVLAAQFERLNRAQAVKYGKVLGLDLPTILLLQKGRAEVDALVKRQKELGVVTENGAISFRRFRSELQDTGHGLQSIFLQAFLKIEPYLSKTLHAVQEFSIYLQKHSGLIKGALIPIGLAIGGFIASLVASNPYLYGTIAALGLLSAAFALVYDDIQTFQRGGKSITGELLEKFPELGVIGSSAFNKINNSIKEVKSNFEALTKAVDYFIDAFKYIDKKIFDPIHKLNEQLGFTSSGKSAVFSLLFAKEELLKVALSPAGSPALRGAINNTSAKSTSVSIGEVQINTQATDATEIAYGLENALQTQFRQAQYQFSGGTLI
jgi:hypothetical protein